LRSFDVAVIGAGAAGQKAAIQAAKLGATVVAIERRSTIGGSVVNAGIPSKTLRESVLYLTGARHRAFGLPEEALKQPIALQDLLQQLGKVLHRETRVMEDQMTRNGVEIAFGPARFVGDHRLLISSTQEEIRAENVILAPGSVAARSKNVPINGETIVDADQILTIRDIPGSLTIVGAGVIGTEYAGIFTTLGVKVTVIDQRAEFLEFIDRDIIRALMGHMEQAGATFRLGVTLDHVEAVQGGAVAILDSGEEILADCLLYSVGRQGATADLGLETVGLQPDKRGRLHTDGNYRTEVPYIYAAGDVIGFPALAASGMEQGRVAARAALGAPTHQSEAGLLPNGIYSVPEIAMVGKTEAQLKEEGIDYVAGVAPYRETARGQIIGDQFGRLKLLADRKSGAILGVHIIGENATELIHIGQTVMNFGGTFNYLVNTVFNYPTLAECYKTAALYVANQIWGETRT
jgi:NAD(P) transhydrogenase